MNASLDHLMWFHRPFRADEWMLYATDSPSASGARGFNRGMIFSRSGRPPGLGRPGGPDAQDRTTALASPASGGPSTHDSSSDEQAWLRGQSPRRRCCPYLPHPGDDHAGPQARFSRQTTRSVHRARVQSRRLSWFQRPTVCQRHGHDTSLRPCQPIRKTRTHRDIHGTQHGDPGGHARVRCQTVLLDDPAFATTRRRKAPTGSTIAGHDGALPPRGRQAIEASLEPFAQPVGRMEPPGRAQDEGPLWVLLGDSVSQGIGASGSARRATPPSSLNRPAGSRAGNRGG